MAFKSTLVALCLAAAVVLGLSPSLGAAAKRRPADSQINVTSLTADGAAGIVESTRAACQGNRRVLFLREETVGGKPAGVLFAETTTRPDGSWSIPQLLYPDQYYAVVVESATKRFNCASSVSPPQDS